MDIGAAHPGRLPGGRDRGRVHDLPLRRGGHHQRPALLRRLRALPQVRANDPRRRAGARAARPRARPARLRRPRLPSVGGVESASKERGKHSMMVALR